MRADKRTHLYYKKTLHKYPIQQNYKYLGIVIQDDIKFDLEKKKRIELMKKIQI